MRYRVSPDTLGPCSAGACRGGTEARAGTAAGACDAVRAAIVGDPEEIAEVAWVSHGDIPTYVPYGLFPQVQAYLDETLVR